MGRVDLHCHLLWGIDDGAKSEAESIEMARVLTSLGYSDVACSPHAREGFPGRDACTARRSEVQATLQREGIALTLHENAENVLDPDLLGTVDAGPRTVGPGPFLLAEAPYLAPVPHLPDLLFRLQLKGVTPLVAHPERCREFEKPGRAAEAVRGGAALQLDMGALIGRYGKQARKLSRAFLAEGLYTVAATDLHSPRDAQAWLSDSIAELRSLAGEAEAEKLLTDNPRRILQGVRP